MSTPPGPGATVFPPAHAHAPPTPPQDAYTDPLDDIYGSAPSSPVLSALHPHPHTHAHTLHTDVPTHLHNNGARQERVSTDEILSDLPSRRRALDTDAYREGLADNKGQYVQQGFDEGYALGANLGLRVGYILGVLQGLSSATLSAGERERHEQARQWHEDATKALAIEELLGQQWVDEEGIWKWDVRGVDADPTFREVAEQHPVIGEWMGRIWRVAGEWGVELERLEGVGEGED